MSDSDYRFARPLEPEFDIYYLNETEDSLVRSINAAEWVNFAAPCRCHAIHFLPLRTPEPAVIQCPYCDCKWWVKRPSEQHENAPGDDWVDVMCTSRKRRFPVGVPTPQELGDNAAPSEPILKSSDESTEDKNPMIKVTRISPTDFSQIPTGEFAMTKAAFIAEHRLIDEGPQGDILAYLPSIENPSPVYPAFEIFKIEELLKVETFAATAQRFTTDYVTFEVYQRSVKLDVYAQVESVEVIVIANGQFMGYVSGRDFDRAKGAAWETVANLLKLDVKTGTPK